MTASGRNIVKLAKAMRQAAASPRTTTKPRPKPTTPKPTPKTPRTPRKPR